MKRGIVCYALCWVAVIAALAMADRGPSSLLLLLALILAGVVLATIPEASHPDG